MSWIYLMIAGLFEIGFAGSLRFTEGFTKTLPTAVFIISAIFSLVFLEKAVAGVPVGTAYAVWTGIGAFGTACIGILVFGEPASVPRLFFLATLIGSIVGLKLTSGQ